MQHLLIKVECMEHLQKRFTKEKVEMLLKGYSKGIIDRLRIENIMGIGKTRFFACLQQ